MISLLRNSHGFAVRVRPSAAWTTDLSTCLRFFFLGMVVSPFVLVSSCVDRPSATGYYVLLRGDNEAAVHWVRGVGGGWNRVPVSLCVSSAFSKCHLDGISRRRTCVVSTTLSPTVSLVGISAPFLIICAPFIPTSRGGFGNWGPSAFLYLLRCWPRTHATRRCGLD